MGHDVDVRGATGVMAGEDGIKESDAVTVALGDTTEKGSILIRHVSVVMLLQGPIMTTTYQIGRVFVITVPIGLDARVDSCRIGLPSLEVEIRGSVTGADVDVLVFEVNGNTGLAVHNICADVFASHVVSEHTFSSRHGTWSGGEESLTVRRRLRE